MELIYKIAAGGMVSVILVVSLRKQNGELALLLSLASCILIAFAGSGLFQKALQYLQELGVDAKINSGILTPLWKVSMITLISTLTETFCVNAGEAAIGRMVELCGGAAAICASLPLMELLMKLIREVASGS